MTYIERLGFGEMNHTWEASVKKLLKNTCVIKTHGVDDLGF